MSKETKQKVYTVGIHERHTSWHLIKADNREQAIEDALNGLGQEVGSEYVDTIDIEPDVREIPIEEAKHINWNQLPCPVIPAER